MQDCALCKLFARSRRLGITGGSIIGDTELGSVRNDLAVLRSDVELLLQHLSIGARDGIEIAMDQIGEGAGRFTQRLSERGRKTTDAVDAWVEQKPFLALLIALGAGYLGARVLRR